MVRLNLIGKGKRFCLKKSFMRYGASTALAGIGLSGCRRPVAKIVPYADSVEWMVPGKSVYYATSMPRLGGSTPIIAKVHEGRPIHLQGNPLHLHPRDQLTHLLLPQF